LAGPLEKVPEKLAVLKPDDELLELLEDELLELLEDELLELLEDELLELLEDELLEDDDVP
jgi:hypothetical protein